MPRLLALGLALLALSGAACKRPPPGPADTYRLLAAAARAGDKDGVWALLAARSRAVLDARAKEVSARSPGAVVPAAGRDLVLGDLAAAAPRLRSVTVVREAGAEATLSVEVEGGAAPGTVTLAREDGVWRVVLPFDN